MLQQGFPLVFRLRNFNRAKIQPTSGDKKIPSNADADAKTQLGHRGNLRHLRSILQIPHLADLDPIAGALLVLDAGCGDMWGSPDLGDQSPIKLRDRVPMKFPEA